MSAIRPARREDLEATSAMLNEHSRRLHGTADHVPSDLLQYWESPDVDREQDVVVAEAPDGTVVGYGDIGLHSGHVWLDVRATDPQALPGVLAAVEERAAAKAPEASLIGYTAADDEPLRELYENAGYELVRHSYRMQIDLDGEPPAADWPDGFTVRTLREGEERRVYDAHNASFADTWMFEQEPYEVWRHWFVADPAFDPSLWLLGEANGDLAGIVIARPSEHEPGLGWIRILGVVPQYRQQGFGQALLRRSFADFASRGFKAVGLGVDAENPTGAVRVYERAGMRVERTNLIYEKQR
jgi:mycothiol synthase